MLSPEWRIKHAPVSCLGPFLAMAPNRQFSSSSFTSNFFDAFRSHEEDQPEPRLAIKTREGEQILRLPSGTKVLVIHNSDVSAQPHHVELGEVTILGPPKEFLRWYCYAVLTAAVCLGLAGLLLFFLFPRPVEIQVKEDLRILPHFRKVITFNNTFQNTVNLHYSVEFQVVNQNYIPITIEEITTKAQVFETSSDLYPHKMKLPIEIPLRSDVNLTKIVHFVLSHNLGFMAHRCNDPKELTHTLDLSMSVTIRYRTMLGREGTRAKTWPQRASCGVPGKEEPGGRKVEKEEWKSLMEGQGYGKTESDGTQEDHGDFHRETDIINIDSESPEGRPELEDKRAHEHKEADTAAESSEGRPAEAHEGRPLTGQEGRPLEERKEHLPEVESSMSEEHRLLTESQLAKENKHSALREGRPLSAEGRPSVPPEVA